MANHIKSWDIQNHKLHTLDGYTIDCVTEGTGLSVCRVLVKEKVEIPPRSFQMLPVEVKGFVPEVVFVDGIQGLQDELWQALLKLREKMCPCVL
ncbi:hypothetical protein DPMN_151807 [Dreissena polymorpha]|uniref:Uncharacterized protein n=1 Tax=Dreissena polymorpha TaxID=45954 RepID=A0A9D4J7C4_DREPO|nr:hypothetical protein DPMN_151807 [Dreissena polymorpha]